MALPLVQPSGRPPFQPRNKSSSTSLEAELASGPGLDEGAAQAEGGSAGVLQHNYTGQVWCILPPDR